MKNEVPYQVPNPTDVERHAILRFFLKSDNREEDFHEIIKLLSPPPNIEKIASKEQGKKFKVAIIGAGLSGLCAAYELNKIGCDITIFEASNRIGGRVKTHFFDKSKNQYGELGPMRIPPSHETTWHYINEFKLRTIPFISKSTSSLFFVRNSYAINNPVSIMENIYPQFDLPDREKKRTPDELIGKLYKKYFFNLSKEERKELLQIKRDYSKKIKEIQSISLRQGYENVGLSQNAISLISNISALEGDLINISLIEILAEYYTLDFLYTYTIEGGIINLPLAFYNQLINSKGPGKVNFRLHSLVNSIIQSPYDGKKIILEILDLNDNSYFYNDFDFVICAIPFSSLRRIKVNPPFTVRKMQAINELNYEIGQKTLLYLKERFWERDKNNPLSGTTLTDLITILTVYPSDHLVPIKGELFKYKLKENTSYKEPGTLLASYNWNQNAVRLGKEYENLRITEIIRSIEKIHKLPEGYMDNNLIDYTYILWSEVPFIWGGVCFMLPNQKELFLYDSTTPEMNGRVHFAGEHVSTKHGWMQGALQSGMLVANNIAKLIRNNYKSDC